MLSNLMVIPRENTSDAAVLYQVYGQQQYAAVGDIGPGLIIDAGANVGYSTMWLAARYPHHQITALEPDKENYRIALANLGGGSRRVGLWQAGLWDHACYLRMVDHKYRDGHAWTRQVQESKEPTSVVGVTVEDLLIEAGEQRVALLKCDIEGAEAIVFRLPVPWIDKVDAIAIELHDDSHFGPASPVFFESIAGQGFEVSTAGELTICKRSNLCDGSHSSS
jgi:FkbM family methyltransferase